MARNLIPCDATSKAIKQRDPRKRLSDGDGLLLRLFAKGGSHGWRFDHRIEGKRKRLSLGTVPSLRWRRPDARPRQLASWLLRVSTPASSGKRRRPPTFRQVRSMGAASRVCRRSIGSKRPHISGSP